MLMFNSSSSKAQERPTHVLMLSGCCRGSLGFTWTRLWFVCLFAICFICIFIY